MKPEGRKSPTVDPSNSKKLSVSMKPKLKAKSPENQSGKLSGKSLNFLSPEVLKTGTRTGRLTRQTGSSRLAEMPRKSSNLSILSTRSSVRESSSGSAHERSYSSAPSNRKRFVCPLSTPITPKIMITKCAKLERLVENKELGKGRKVLRSKVKSPVGSKLGKSGNKDLKDSGGKIVRGKMLEFENQLKRRDSEILNLNRKLNTIQKVVSEKEKVIQNLELKFPRMLSELKKGLNDERKANVELKETLRKNNQLSGVNKQTEGQLKVKDDKIKELTLVKKKLLEDLTAKDLELSEFRQRLETLEQKLPDLLNEVESKEEDLGKCKETVEFLEQRLVFQSEENNNKDDEIEELKNQIQEFSDELLDKDNEIIDVRANNYELRSEILEQYEKLEKTDLETKNYLDIIDNIRGKIEAGPQNVKILHDSIDCLDKATEDFLDKVSAVSKESNMSFNLKLRVRKSRTGGSFRDQSSGNLGRYLLHPVSFDNNNSTRVSFNSSMRHSSSRNSAKFSPKNSSLCASSYSKYDAGNSCITSSRGFIPNSSFDDVFDVSNCEQLDDFDSKYPSKTSNADSSLGTDASRDDVDVSSDTCMRLEVLDNKVRSLWTKLSQRDESFEEFKSDRKQEFSNSVSKLKDDLSDSIQQHNRFLTQVNVAKKLFN